MRKFEYLASKSDGKEILRVLESSAAKGNIELIYTRRPDAYESYMKDTADARVFVSKREDRVVGTCAELVRDVYIGGKIRRAAYICGLKKDAEYEGSIGFGSKFIHDLQSDNIDFYYCSVIADNVDVQRTFEKSRRIFSAKQHIGI